MGKMQFDRQTVISATTNKVIKWFKTVSTDPLQPNVYERHTFFSSKNTTSKIFNIQMLWGGVTDTAITGGRTLGMGSYMDSNTTIGIFSATSSVPQNDFSFDQGTFKNGGGMDVSNIQYIPNDIAGVNANIRSVVYDDVIGVTFEFFHQTNATVLGEARSVVFFVEEEVVAR